MTGIRPESCRRVCPHWPIQWRSGAAGRCTAEFGRLCATTEQHSMAIGRGGPMHLAVAPGETADMQAEPLGGGPEVAGVDRTCGLFDRSEVAVESREAEVDLAHVR